MKLHLCCGDIYLDGYTNIDVDGIIYEPELMSNPNETDLEHYFKYPFIEDPVERQKNKRPFLLDRKMNILEAWPFEDDSIEEIVMISCIEHFNPKTELPHIIKEINRVMKAGGQLKTDWPDLKAQMEMYYESDPDFCMELIYCNHKNQYSIHHWGFTPKTFPKYLGENWSYEFREVVKHDYPMQGCIATKRK